MKQLVTDFATNDPQSAAEYVILYHHLQHGQLILTLSAQTTMLDFLPMVSLLNALQLYN